MKKGTKVDMLAEASEYVPDEMRGLFACLECGLILSRSQWASLKDYCPNCKQVTSNSDDFGGMVALMQPKESWVAKWNRFTRYVPGNYAI